MSDVIINLRDIRTRIADACKQSSRDPSSVSLVAVSKMQSTADIQAALDAGQRVFGENRVQEAQDHWAAIKPRYSDLELHLIGSLQTNKATDAVALFDVIQSVDREKLVDALVIEMKKQNRPLPCYIQVNTGDEDQKGGVAPDLLQGLYNYAVNAGLKVTGLMCIPPIDQTPMFHFGLLATWAKRLGLKNISMGMSGDFEDAIRCGATHVRIGSALFGARQTIK
ncbi:MAG TPA: YggS family pyridoxal phosphate-dependent enzyme [Alphaproteobacteria bacterium]